MAMVVGPQPGRGPPRLLCLLMLVVIAIASFVSIFTQIFGDRGSGLQRREESLGSWRRPVLEAESGREQGFQNGRVWRPVDALRQLLPYAARSVSYHAPVIPGRGFLFATIRGELHEIHAAVCDFVVIARLLNATIVLPKIQGIVSVKGGGSKVERFSYLYDEQRFITALKDDVRVVKRLPKKFRTRASLQKQSVKTPARLSSVHFYLDEVLPALTTHGACGLVFSDGGGLQSLLPPELVEYQRLRCRVAFHVLRFRREIHELGVQLVRRLEAHGRPYVVVHFGLERDVLAHYGCAELFQDLQTESIQSQRKHMLSMGKDEVSDLQIDSQKQRRSGLCPLMPGEVGILLESFGFRNDTRIYMTGTEITGGQRILLPLRSMYANLDDRFTMSTLQERSSLHGPLQQKAPRKFSDTLNRLIFWRRNGSPTPHSKTSSPKGWWRSVGECEYDTENYFTSTPVEGESKDIQLLHAALDYVVSLEANTYFPAFDRDRHGFPNIASLIMGHRLYQSASLKTFRLNRSAVATFLDECPHEHSHNWSTWVLSVQKFLLDSLQPHSAPGSAGLHNHVKSEMFLAHPLPECACQTGESMHDANRTFQRLSADERLVWEGVTMCQ
ncbi:hypothetical protein M758_3G059600 [Ceratodon purpureus]|nr:hypothetical protein M758_3G059600 [Ceratodon purpureus]